MNHVTPSPAAHVVPPPHARIRVRARTRDRVTQDMGDALVCMMRNQSPSPPAGMRLPEPYTTVVLPHTAADAAADAKAARLVALAKRHLADPNDSLVQQQISERVADVVRAVTSGDGIALTIFLATQRSEAAEALLYLLLYARDDGVRDTAFATMLARAEGQTPAAQNIRDALKSSVDGVSHATCKIMAQSLLASGSAQGRATVMRLLQSADSERARAVAQGLAARAKDTQVWPKVLALASIQGPHRISLVETLQHVLHRDERRALLTQLMQDGDTALLDALFAVDYESHVLRDAGFAALFVPHMATSLAPTEATLFAERLARAQDADFALKHWESSDALCAAVLRHDYARPILHVDVKPRSAHVARLLINASKKPDCFAGNPLLREAQLRRWTAVVIAPDALDEMRQLDLRALMFVREHVQTLLHRVFPETMACIENKNFDPSSLTHRVVSYLRALALPHAFKFLHCDKTFDYAAWEGIIERGETRATLNPANNRPHSEALYLGYDSHLYMERVVKPAQQRAQALGIPLMLVANVTYGGTLMSALPLRKLERDGIKIVFTRMPSSVAHGSKDCLEESLFTPEQLRFVLKEQPIVAVADGSRIRHYPDGLRGYHNMALLLNEALGVDVSQVPHQRRTHIAPYLNGAMPSVRAMLAALCADAHTEAREHLSAARPRSWLSKWTGPQNMATPQRGFGIFYQSSHGANLQTEFGDLPGPFNWHDDVRGPAWVNVFASPSEQFLRRQRWKANGAAWRVTLAARFASHAQAYYAHRAEQVPRAYMGKRGLNIKPLDIHEAARALFKKLQGA